MRKGRMRRSLLSALLVAVMLIGNCMVVSAAPQTMPDGIVFDAEYYAQSNPDVVAAIGTDANALYQHYVNFGRAEGRLPYAGATAAAAPSAGTVAAGPGARLLDRSTIQFSAHFASLPASDDGMLYVYELAVFEDAIPAGRAPIMSVPMTADPVVTFPYNAARLYEKFAFVTMKGGVPTIAGNPQFITNPEVLADKNVSRPAAFHGLQGPTHEYQFNNYPMQGGANNGYPIAYLAKTVAVLNNSGNPTITHPLGRSGYAGDPHPVDEQFNIFMFNAADQAGVAALTSEMSWLAKNGSADVFIIGNEVNVRKWNYIQWQGGVSWEYYVDQYADAFRVMYNAIKSQNAGAEVLICIDQCWDRNRSVDRYNYIDGKDFCDTFNAIISAGGNIDWGISVHPHPVPLTNAKFWATGSYERAQINSNKMITFENLSVVVNYLSQPQFLAPDGSRRYMIDSEEGLVNTQGDAVQGAAIAAAYESARRNGLSQIIFLGDNHGPGLDYTMIGQAAAVYNSFGTPQEAAYMEWAKGVIGISDWSQVLR